MKKLMLMCVALLALSACDPAKRLNGTKYSEYLQKQYSYENAMSANRAFTLSSAKDALKQAEKDAKEEEKKARAQAKIDAVREKTAEIKNNN